MSDPSLTSTTYLTQPQTSHLVSLHHLLSLPATSLQSDHQRIALAIRAAVDAVIRDREDEVQEWRERIRDGIRDIAGVERATGVGRGEGRRFEIKDNEPLPEQYEQLTKHRETLLDQYSSRLLHLQTLHTQLSHLATLLGEGFTCPALLPIQSTRTSLQSNGQQTIATEWIDVCESTVENFESLVQAAETERTKRMMLVVESFLNLHYQYQELSLPPLLPQPHHVQAHLLPSRATEETPGIHATYERAFWRFHERAELEYEPPAEDEAVQITEARDRALCESLEKDGVEPTLGLIAWAEAVNDLWQNECAARQSRIQEIYDAIFPLWARLDIAQEDQDEFTDGHRGCSEAVIRAYEIEWERLLDIRKSSLSAFVLGARREIEELADQLMMGADERAEFVELIDDDFTEELLHAHEQEVERLKDEIQTKETLLPRVREWMQLKLDEEELERSANDPNRFSKRGGAMLKEERMRKRVNGLKPKVEAELMTGLPAWEEASGRPFLVQGLRVVDTIREAMEAKEMAKEAKKVVRGRPVPAVARATPAPATSRKRPMPAPSTGPGPTPMGQNQAKRMRLNTASSSIASTAASSRAPRSVSASSAYPPPLCALPRPTARVLSSSTLANACSSKPPMNGWNTGLGKDGGRKPERRGSFKPRLSVLPLPKHRAGDVQQHGWELQEEEEDVF